MEIDIHDMDVLFAKGYIKDMIEYTSDKELVIIHGYRNGDKLRNMVQKEFKHKKVARKLVGLNKGITTYILK